MCIIAQQNMEIAIGCPKTETDLTISSYPAGTQWRVKSFTVDLPLDEAQALSQRCPYCNQHITIRIELLKKYRDPLAVEHPLALIPAVVGVLVALFGGVYIDIQPLIGIPAFVLGGTIVAALIVWHLRQPPRGRLWRIDLPGQGFVSPMAKQILGEKSFVELPDKHGIMVQHSPVQHYLLTVGYDKKYHVTESLNTETKTTS
ncbi:MAG: hypothetical protein GYB65_04505 [Chloroflexi bacterium]|nr:hypothetical protein [Chloroflexota bacterium]